MRRPWWLSGTHLPVQETLVPYLVREDPTCYGTTKLMHIRKQKKKMVKMGNFMLPRFYRHFLNSLKESMKEH